MTGLRTFVLGLLAAGAASADLAPFKYEGLPLGAVKASGWLQDELVAASHGLAGNMFDFYNFVANSTWMGGDSEYSDLHESGTYWFNGLVPMAFILDDDKLKAQVKKFLDHQIDNQQDDGWLGAETTRNTRVLWGRAYLLLGMMQYAEADPSEADRIADAMNKYVGLTNSMLKNNFTGLIPDPAKGDTFDGDLFGVARAHETAMALEWLYENHAGDNGDTIMETIDLLFEGTRKGNSDWNDYFTDEVFPKEARESYPNILSHGVNIAEALRYATVLYRTTKDESLIEKTHQAYDLVKTYQTSLSGTIMADEFLGGLNPYRGSELCMTVESMFSHGYLYRFHGNNEYADMAERAAFNALPAAVTTDWWGHSYITQTNQPWAKNVDPADNPWYNVGNYGLVYGLEPNYPCCTVNHPQGYPKFVAQSYAKNGEDGLVHTLLSPTKVNTKIGDSDVSVSCDTNYPFADELNYSIDSDTDFNFFVRIPEWTVLDDATIKVGDEDAKALSPNDDNHQQVSVKKGITKITVTLPMKIETVMRGESVAFYRGPLLYASDIQYKETKATPKDSSNSTLPSEAYDASFEPTSEWKFAVDPSTVKLNKGDETASLPSPVFVNDGPPTSLEVDAYLIDWDIKNGTADAPPENPTVDASKKTTIKLIPYGAAKLHIAEFPVAKLDG